jgi:hypothetical protein
MLGVGRMIKFVDGDIRHLPLKMTEYGLIWFNLSGIGIKINFDQSLISLNS